MTTAEKVAEQLKTKGYAIHTTPSGMKLHNSQSNRTEGLDALRLHYIKLSGNTHYSKAIENQFISKLPVFYGEYFNPEDAPGHVNGAGLINRYQRFTPTQPAATDLTLWHEYLNRMFADATDRKVFTQYIAHMLRHPEQRPNWHLVIPSDQGTGKGFTWSYLLTELLCEQHITKYSSFGDVWAKHNCDWEDKILMVIDDAKQGTPTTIERLKTFESEKRQLIEPKGQRSRMVRTYSRILIFTNLASVLPFQEDDRRHYVTHRIKHAVDRFESSAFYQDTMIPWLKSGGFEAVYQWLMELDLSDFNPESAPRCAEIARLAGQSVTEADEEALLFIEKHRVFSASAFADGVPSMTDHTERHAWLQAQGFTKHRLFKLHPTIPGGYLWYAPELDKDTAREWFQSYYYPKAA